MVLKARTTQQFKATIGIMEDGVVSETKEVTFNFPRAIDYHVGENGNKLENLYYTYANMACRFDKPMQCSTEDGSILNIHTFRELVDMGYAIDIGDIGVKEQEAMIAAREEADKLIKKPKLDGNSDKKVTSVDKN